eukprot:6583965-Prymnesium_polylepis.1
MHTNRIEFDAGYCSFYAFAHQPDLQQPSRDEYIHVIRDEPRHPDALSSSRASTSATSPAPNRTR